jgi:sugar/nucleoside kinase (ribokinase family)
MVLRTGGQTTSIASIWADSTAAERTIIFSPGSASDMLEWTPDLDKSIAKAKIIHLNGRHPEVCANAIEVAKSSGVTVSFDGGAYRYREQMLPMMRAADIAIVAREFAESHYQRRVGSSAGVANADLAEFLMADLSCQIVGVTDGKAGSDLIERSGGCVHQPAVKVEHAIDTTGCGDTYHGAFLHSIARGRTVKESAQLAAAVSSANARQIGGLAFSARPFGPTTSP